MDKHVSIKEVELDTDYELLKSTYNSILPFKIIANNIGIEYGGLGADFKENNVLLEFLSKTSAALCLLIVQNITSTEIISNFASEDFKQIYLTQICNNKITVGIVASHLHNKNNLVYGEDKKNYFIVNGTVKFYSGYKFFDHLLLGFTDDNSEYFAILTADELIQEDLITYQDIASCSSSNTISFVINNFKIDKKLICYQQQRGKFGELKMKSFSSCFLVSGIIMRLFNLLDQNLYILNNEQIKLRYISFKDNLYILRNNIFASYKELNPVNMRVKFNILSNYLLIFAEQVLREECLIRTNYLNKFKNEIFLFSVLSVYDDLTNLTSLYLKDLYS